MPLLQVRDCPEDIYKKVALAAKRKNRTIAQQIVVFLGKSVGQEQPNVERKKTAAKKDPSKENLRRSQENRCSGNDQRGSGPVTAVLDHYVEDWIELIDDFFEAKELCKEALSEGIKNTHSVYDMYYAVLARRNDATILKNDGQLGLLCKKLKLEVVI